MLTDLIRTPFPQAGAASPRRSFKSFFVEAVWLIGFATLATATHVAGVQWNAYYQPLLLSAFLVPALLFQTYRSNKAFSLGYVFAGQLLMCIWLMCSFAVIEVYINGFRSGVDFWIALAILPVVVALELVLVVALLRCFSSPKRLAVDE